jgi:hypothetical protein
VMIPSGMPTLTMNSGIVAIPGLPLRRSTS